MVQSAFSPDDARTAGNTLCVLTSETFVSLGFLAKYGGKDASQTCVERYVSRLLEGKDGNDG